MKRVLVNQGSVVEVMYLDLYRGLNLKPEELMAYDSPLVSFKGEDRYSEGPNQTAHIDQFRRGRGGFHCGRYLFTLHSYCGKTFASCPRGCLFYTSPEGEIPVGRPGRRDCGESNHGQTVHGGCHLMPTQC